MPDPPLDNQPDRNPADEPLLQRLLERRIEPDGGYPPVSQRLRYEEIAIVAAGGVDDLPENRRALVIEALASDPSFAELLIRTHDSIREADQAAALPDSIGRPDAGTKPIVNKSDQQDARDVIATIGPARRLVLPAWSVAASIALVSGVGLLVSAPASPPTGPSSDRTIGRDFSSEAVQTSPSEDVTDPKQAMSPTLTNLHRWGLIGGVLGMVVLTPVAWRRLRSG